MIYFRPYIDPILYQYYFTGKHKSEMYDTMFDIFSFQQLLYAAPLSLMLYPFMICVRFLVIYTYSRSSSGDLREEHTLLYLVQMVLLPTYAVHRHVWRKITKLQRIMPIRLLSMIRILRMVLRSNIQYNVRSIIKYILITFAFLRTLYLNCT